MRIVFFFLLVCLVPFHLFANEKVHIGALPSWLYPVRPNPDKKPVARDISNGYYFEWLDFQTNLLTNTEYTHFIKHIVNESGVQNASEISVTFSPQFQQVIFHRVTVLRDGAILNQLQPGQIKVVQEETDAGDFEYNGLKRAFITLKDVRKNDRIEVAYSVIGFNPVFGNKYTDEIYFGNSTAVCNYSRTIITRSDRKLLIQTLNNAPHPVEQQQGNTLSYHWDNPPLKNGASESSTPSWYNNYPTVYVTEYNSWQEVVNWGLNTFNNYKYPLPESLQHKIAGWRKLSKSDKDGFANLAARFVQDEVRYLGLEIGPNTHRPHPPADVYTHRFGDCKDKALLLSSILQQEGIPAYVALISTTTRDKLTTVAPSPTCFNHAIVAIERSKGVYIYVDPTISGQRGELIDLYVPAYGYALILRNGEDRLQPVEPGFEYNYSITESLEVKYYDTSRFTVRSTYSGGAADKIRDALSETSVKELEDNYRKYYATLFDGIRLDGPITSSDDSLKNDLVVTEQYSIPQIWNTSQKGKKAFDFTVKILSEHLPNPSSATTEAPLALAYPRSVDYTLNISMPEDWPFNSGELHIKNRSYQFDFIPKVNGSHMTLHYSLKTFKDHIPAGEITQYKSDYKNIEERVFFRLYKNITPDGAAADEPSPSASPSASPAPSAGPSSNAKACWPAIWLTFFFSLLFTWLFRRLNARSEDTIYAPGSGYPLGGWTIILGITIGLTIGLNLINFIRNNYFSYHNWALYGNAGGSPLQYLYMTEMAISLVCISGSAAIGYWFLRRRDIFPRMFVWYAGILLSSRLLLYFLYQVTPIPASLNTYRESLIGQFFRTLFYAGIWVTYVLRSEQVKSTFLEPYREKS
jgi:hypothetical protein